jgi:hypothetical protein
MSSGSDFLAIVSVAIAGLSLLVAGGALWFARRVDKRAERGQPSAQYLGFSADEVQRRDTVEFITFKFRITNVGAAGARHIALHLRDQTEVKLPERSAGVSLPPGNSDDVTVTVRDPTRYSYPLKVWLEWQHWERPKPLYMHDSSEVVPNPF